MIRKFNLNDIDKIIELEKDTLGTTLGETYLKDAYTNQFNYIYVYELNFNIVGYISYTFDEEIAEMLNFCVDKSMQNKGIGTKLLNYTIKEFENLKGSSIILEVNSINDNAIKLYKKMGFKQISKRKAYYSDGNDALVLQKLLEGVI